MTTSYTIFSSILFSIIDIFIYYRLLSHKLSYRFSKRTVIPVHILLFIIMYASQWASELITTIPLKFPLMLLFYWGMFLIYKDEYYKRFLWIAVSLIMFILSELIIIPITLFITHTEFRNLLQNEISQSVGLVLSRLLMLLITEIFLRLKIKVSFEFIKNYLPIILIDILYATIIYSLFYYGNIYLDVNTAIALSVCVMFVISYLAIFLLHKVSKKSEEIMDTNLRLQQMEMEHKLNQDMAIVVENLRSLRHDMNNHMSILQGLLSMEEYSEACSYLSSITEELNTANSFVIIENKILSVIINNKIQKARQLGITLDTEIFVNNTPLSDRDLCAIVSNVLENAIEASSKHEHPYIEFSMKKVNNQLRIQCDNTYTVAPVFENNHLITTKQDKAYHGIGTKTICSVVESYHGTTQFSADDMFHVQIAIPL